MHWIELLLMIAAVWIIIVIGSLLYFGGYKVLSELLMAFTFTGLIIFGWRRDEVVIFFMGLIVLLHSYLLPTRMEISVLRDRIDEQKRVTDKRRKSESS